MSFDRITLDVGERTVRTAEGFVSEMRHNVMTHGLLFRHRHGTHGTAEPSCDRLNEWTIHSVKIQINKTEF